MAEVMNVTSDSLDKPPSTQSGPSAMDDDLPPPPPPSSHPPPHSLNRRRDRDFRDRRDDRDFDRHPGRRGGNYYDRNMSPPPPPLPRDRDRDFKRRRSPSPPYRDRRFSPPRRSPPPFKRSRRGSPRGGFGYDHVGGYERGMGGRLGLMEDEGHGRLMHRSGGGYQNGLSGDVDAHRVYADSANIGGAQREGLMSYKQFIQELEDDVLPAEAERRYQEYKSEYISTQKKAYFNVHKHEEWLKDKYHPTNLITVIERRNETARRFAKDFFLDLQSGTLDLNPGFNASSSIISGQAIDPTSDDEDAIVKRRRHGRVASKENGFTAAPKAPLISSDPSRIQADIEQTQALVRKLDIEKGIEDNILSGGDNKNEKDRGHSGSMGPIIIIRGLTSVKGLEGIELLDTLLTYLWRIHGVDYYGMRETHEAKGFRHIRPDGKVSDETSKSGSEWEKKLDLYWQERLNGQDPLEVMAARDKIDAEAMKVLDPHVRKIRDEKYGWKYGCGAKGCTKLFHAAEFVHKHLKLKHPELVMELTSKVREDLYFENYMNDPDAPGGTPVMQQPQREKPPKRRLLEGRLRDDRGNRRDHDIRMNDMDNSPSRDRQRKAGGPDVGNHDESMFDAFTGQGMGAVTPFSSDMPPPPVLMPVPGAGPLGPFVPAPPEVAMQMLRDQGGPSTFDGAGRNMRSGPDIYGAAPIIAVPPDIRPDPRRMRSYEDLDAPEDEVTVIDYRSL